MIEARGLSKRYGGTLAVDDLSFDVRPGHVTGFLGPNGAGKSTTMRLILGLDRPSKGRVTVNGRPYSTIGRPVHQVGALLDAKELHGGRSAYNHLLCLAQSNGIGRRRIDEVLDLVGLTGVAKRRAGKFSLGMSQRLGIAAALLGDPDVLMFDEPVNGLDPEGIRWIRNLLKGLASEGRTVFVSSHLMAEMALTADHLIVIGRGRLIADMPTQDFIRASSQSQVRVRSPQVQQLADAIAGNGGQAAPDTNANDGSVLISGMAIERVGELAASQGIVLHELAPERASLEDAFMELTKGSVEYHGGMAPSAARPQPNPAGEEAAR